MKNNASYRIPIYLPPPLRVALERYCRTHDIKRTAVVRLAVNEYLRKRR